MQHKNKKDISWKTFGLTCLALASFVGIAETTSAYPRLLAAEKPAAKAPGPAGEAIAPEDVPPPITSEAQLPPELRAEPQKPEEIKPGAVEALGARTAKLQVTVIDGRTKKPIDGAEVVLIETGDRVRTDTTGKTPFINAPVPREEKGRKLLNRLHGQLGVIAYKKGYRDSITFGVRMHEGKETHVTVWMYQIIRDPATGKLRVEPVLYEVPYHHLYLIQLADAFRSRPDEGEGMESADQP